MKLCHKCGAEWKGEGRPSFHEECTECHAFLHCCLNCRLYDQWEHNQCRSPTTEPVPYKESDNFCEEFDFIEGEREIGDKSAQARQAWKKLFGEE